MAKDKIRVSKPPEERRQEIMDTAMRVFAEKGYEQTTMRDIASAVGVVPGLCYRYFESKQVLFEQAVRQYVSDYCAPIVRALKEHSGDMSSAFDRAAALFLTSGSRENTMPFSTRRRTGPSTHCSVTLSVTICCPLPQSFLTA